jgi:hypothetical protein
MTRFVHLTYASLAGAADSAGGWQFKQDSGSTAAERERVLELVPTALHLARPLSRYPAADELAGAPRRLVFAGDADGRSAYLVHSVAAGPDATLRPGNVFSQVLIDRELTGALAADDPLRPIEYWRSPTWLTPYGPDAVRSADVDESALPARGPIVNRERISEFVKDDRTPVGRLTELLNATAAALEDDTAARIVLVVDDLDDAARWIGAVSFLAAPPTAARLTFSTYERTEDLMANGARAMLSAVLRTDFFDRAADHPTVAANQDRLTFFDLSWEAEVVSYGPQAPPSDWSALVVELFDETAATIHERLLMMDGVSRQYPEAACPWWPLGVTMARTESSEEGQQAAAATILRNTPEAIDFDPDLSLIVRNVLTKVVKCDRAAFLTVLGDRDRRVSPSLPLLDMALAAVAGTVPDDTAGDTSANPVLEAVIAEIRNRGDVQSSWAVSALVLLDQLMKASGLVDSGRWHSQVADALAIEVRRDPGLPDSFDGPLDEKTRRRVAATMAEGAEPCP